jgi:hypothetical protein
MPSAPMDLIGVLSQFNGADSETGGDAAGAIEQSLVQRATLDANTWTDPSPQRFEIGGA